MFRATFLLSVVFSIALMAPAYAQAPSQNGSDIVIAERNWAAAGSYRLDLTVPESPAFALLGLDSPEVATPRDMPALTAELANLVGSDGQLKPGAAITVQPYWLGGRDITLDDYRATSRRFERALLARTRLSFASASVDGSEDAVRVALGVTFQPSDYSDPRMDQFDNANVNAAPIRDGESEEAFLERATLPQCMTVVVGEYELFAAEKAHEQLSAESRVTNSSWPSNDRRHDDYVEENWPARATTIVGEILSDDETKSYRPQHVAAVQGFEDCERRWRERQAQRPNFMVAIGQTFLSEDGSSDALKSEGLTAWVGYSRSLGDIFPSFRGGDYSSRVNFYARFAEDETVAIDEDTSARAEVSVAAVSINLANIRRDTRNWSVGVEAAYRTEDFSDATEDREFTQIALNGSVRLNDGLWLRAAYGTRGEEDDEFFRLSFVMAERAPN